MNRMADLEEDAVSVEVDHLATEAGVVPEALVGEIGIAIGNEATVRAKVHQVGVGPP